MIRTRLMRSTDALDHVMPWFAQGVDAADGTLSLKRRWWLFGPRDLSLDWQIEKSKRVIDAIVAMHKRLATATGGHAGGAADLDAAEAS